MKKKQNAIVQTITGGQSSIRLVKNGSRSHLMANIIPCRSILSKLVKPNCISSLSMSSMPKAPSGPLVAVAQLTATSNHDKNFMDVSICAHQAAEQGCSFLALPECFSFIGSSVQETLDQVYYFPFFFLLLLSFSCHIICQ